MLFSSFRGQPGVPDSRLHEELDSILISLSFTYSQNKIAYNNGGKCTHSFQNKFWSGFLPQSPTNKIIYSRTSYVSVSLYHIVNVSVVVSSFLMFSFCQS